MIGGLPDSAKIFIMNQRPQQSVSKPGKRLDASPATTRVGYFDNEWQPVLRIACGETIRVETWDHFGDGISERSLTEDLVEFRKKAREKGLPITHVVNGIKGVHCMLPKSVLNRMNSFLVRQEDKVG